jgi:transcription-repair coupling factor (superfamily II helicase)
VAARAARAVRAAAVREAVRQATAPPAPSPAQSAMDGRALLAAARELLAGLARCARDPAPPAA